MKKQLLFAAGAALALFAYAEPAGGASVSDLLGVKPGAGSNVFASYGAANGSKAYAVGNTLKINRGGVKVSSESSPVAIVGCVVSPDHITGMWTYGIDQWMPERIKGEDGKGDASKVYATGGGIAANDGYYYVTQYREAMGFEEIKTINYDMADNWSEYDSYTGAITTVATTMAYSENRDQAFGCFINENRDGYVFCEYNYRYFGIKRTICPIEKDKVWAGCAFSSDNTLYAITRAGELYTVDLATGEMTLVGITGIQSIYQADATIDTDTDIMYWCVNSDTENALYAVDLNSATPTKLYDMGNEEQLCGMFIPHTVVTPAEAPAAGSVSVSFSGASLSGKAIINTPRLQYDGKAALDASTELTWVLTANGKELARGTELPNKQVVVPVTMDKADSYYFAVVTSNAAGKSPIKGTKKFVGPDTPQAPSMFNLTLNGKTINLQWGTPSSTGVNGGNVEYSKATYTVVRYPDMKVIADGITTRTATDELPETEEMVEYSYGLVATVNGLSAPEKKSNTIKAGAIVPPTTIEFASSLSLYGWTILEGSIEDSNKWKYYSSDKCVYLYTSSSTGQDDYLISPAVNVKAGAVYPISLDIKTSNYYEETFEVLWGTEPTIEAMTNVAVAESKQKSTTWTTYEGKIAPTADGKIYFAIHDKTATASQLYARNITIGEGVISLSPNAVEFSVAPAKDGTGKAVITYTLPTTTVDGSAITEATAITKVEILRDGKAIYTATENLPAGEATFTDAEGLELGKHTYDVIAHNAYGAGKKSEIEVLVGPGVPAAATNVLMLEEGNTGKVTVTWDPVTTDVDGNAIMASAITYKVIDRNYNVLAENLTETTFSTQAVDPETQAFCQFGVYAVTVGGESKLAGSAYKPVGKPYATPWTESFADGMVSSIFGYNYIKGDEPWRFGADSDWSAAPQDGDNGLAYFEAYGMVQTALVTGKIDLSDVANPALTYYLYRYSDTDYTNEILVEADCGDGNGFVPVQSDCISNGEVGKWHKVLVDLSDYEGKSVVLRLVPDKIQGAWFFLDNMRIAMHADYNLTASRIEAPSAVGVNEDFEINVTVTNTGDKGVRRYEVELYSGEEFIDTKAGISLAAEASQTLTFVTSATVLHGESRDFHAVVVFENDEVESDNTTDVVTVGIVAPAVPVPTNLVAEKSGEAVRLTWSDPNMEQAAPAAYTETFEGASRWAQEVDGWKIIDGDQAPLISIGNQAFQFNAGKLAGWWVNDQNWNENAVELWASHSGEKYLASGSVMRGSTNVQCDDWAISPRLYGCEQIISLYARSFYGEGSYAGMYQEDFEVLYSTTTTNVDDFVSAGTFTKVPFSWTKYSFRVPQGALYFAIRSRSIDKFFLFVDDVTYIPATGEKANHELKGYNVYRNGVKINGDFVGAAEYIDANAKADFDHSYVVTAHYAAGESRPSNEATINLSGIAGIENGGISVAGGEGCIFVSGAEGKSIEVYAPQGVLATAMANAPAAARIEVGAGVYIVRVGGKTVKVAVK
ncbi:MAG: choice-of-anchor J domain-containing protein [Clostridium sp.]|nr:choice-of-anchor J domain-containing protein [Clostridium sp.]